MWINLSCNPFDPFRTAPFLRCPRAKSPHHHNNEAKLLWHSGDQTENYHRNYTFTSNIIREAEHRLYEKSGAVSRPPIGANSSVHRDFYMHPCTKRIPRSRSSLSYLCEPGAIQSIYLPIQRKMIHRYTIFRTDELTYPSIWMAS